MTQPSDSTTPPGPEGEPGTDTAIGYEFTLFVNGASEMSGRAIVNARYLCDTHLGDRYHLAVVDVREDQTAVRGSGVLAVPTLVKNLPLPARQCVGDMSNTDRVLRALDLPHAEDASGAPVEQ